MKEEEITEEDPLEYTTNIKEEVSDYLGWDVTPTDMLECSIQVVHIFYCPKH